MKIKVIIPVSTDKWDANVQAGYERYKGPETLIHAIHLNHGPEAIQSERDEAAAASHVWGKFSLCSAKAGKNSESQ